MTVAAVLAVLITGGLLGGPAGAAAAGGESAFVGLTPCRLVDTRGNGFGGPFGPPALATGIPRDFPLQGQCGIPATAVGVSLNVTATNTQGPGFLLLSPQGGALPLVSTLNYVAGQTVANAAIVPLGAGGLTVVAGVAGADLILDVNGYFEDSLVHDVGADNIFVGPGAGNLGTTGEGNTGVGAIALQSNTTGRNNTATGGGALVFNTTGSFNTATGTSALRSNTTADGNTATGNAALINNTTGGSNTAVGDAALYHNTTGGNNTAVGPLALFYTTGSNNTALGYQAGFNATTGNDNIYIAHLGVAAESATTRIGATGAQTKAFIAGIRGVMTGGPAIAVLVDPSGQLGTTSSSRRTKEAIEPMGEASQGLLRLRPVTFRYRQAAADGTRPRQYGLIAEEVAEVYPDLVASGADGQPETVLYHVLPALLLNELQRQHRTIEAQQRRIEAQVAQLAELSDRLARLEAQGRPALAP